MGSIKNETVRAAQWVLIQKCTLQPIQLIYGMILARFISPAEMGIIGLTAIFFAIASQLSTAGFAAALIRKLDRSDDDLNTAFWFNLIMSGVLGGCLFMLSPWFASYFAQPELLWLTRISAVMLFISSSTGVHTTIYQYKRDFKSLAIIGIASTISGMPVCLALAYFGYGVWALCAQQVTSAIVTLFMVWKLSEWHPQFIFSKKSFNYLFSFGNKIALAGIVHSIYAHLKTFIIGKFYSPTQLGLFYRANTLAAVFPNTLNSTLASITFPILSTIQNDTQRLCQVYKKYIKLSSLVIAWVSMFAVFAATPLVSVLYGEKWVACSIYLQILCFEHAFIHISDINQDLLKILGRSSLFLKIEMIKKILSVVILIFAAKYGVSAICFGFVTYSQISIVINCHYTKKLIGLSWMEQQKDYLPYYFFAAVASYPTLALNIFEHIPVLQVLFGGIVSFVLYFGSLWLLRDKALDELICIIQEKVKYNKTT